MNNPSPIYPFSLNSFPSRDCARRVRIQRFWLLWHPRETNLRLQAQQSLNARFVHRRRQIVPRALPRSQVKMSPGIGGGRAESGGAGGAGGHGAKPSGNWAGRGRKRSEPGGGLAEPRTERGRGGVGKIAGFRGHAPGRHSEFAHAPSAASGPRSPKRALRPSVGVSCSTPGGRHSKFFGGPPPRPCGGT